jgi:microcystin-dependent protein
MSNYYGFNGYPIPTGAILPFVAGTTARIPDSYLYCNGGEYNPLLYPELFAVLGTQFNTGGETAGFFRVPDLVTNPYTNPGAFNPVPPPAVVFTEDVLLTTNELPSLITTDFTAGINFDPATTPSLYEHNNANNIFGDNGSITTFTKANSSTRTTFAVAITGGTDPSYTPPAPVVPCVANVSLGEVTPIGYLFIHIIKAFQIQVQPQELLPPLVEQYPAPQYLNKNMAWLSGGTFIR